MILLCSSSISLNMFDFAAGDAGEVADGVVHGSHHRHAHQLPQLPDGVVQGAGVEQARGGARLPEAGGEQPGAEAGAAGTSLTPRVRLLQGQQEPRIRLYRAPVGGSDEGISASFMRKNLLPAALEYIVNSFTA